MGNIQRQVKVPRMPPAINHLSVQKHLNSENVVNKLGYPTLRANWTGSNLI